MVTMCATVYTMHNTRTRRSYIRANAHEMGSFIAKRYDVVNTAGTMWAHNGADEHTELGELPISLWSEIRNAEKTADFYVVKSYITPIAWFTEGAWVIPDVRYSSTTSRHQNIVRKALA